MKTLLRIVILAFAILYAVSCSPVVPVGWEGTPNPLDTPETNTWRPASEGRFGHNWMNR